MAVEDDDVRVFERITFDGDWPKAAAIDTAVTYSYLMIEEHRRRVERQVAGRQPIASQDFTVVTSVFLDVLRQQGYIILLKEDQNELNRKVEELLQRSMDALQRGIQQRDRIDQLEEELDRLQATVREKDIEIRLLKDAPEPSTDDLFHISSCAQPSPYSLLTGNPCNSHEGGGVHRYVDDLGNPKERWSQKEGVAEMRARELKRMQHPFSVSKCTEVNPYNPANGDPCTKHLGSGSGDQSIHMSGPQPGEKPEERWRPDEGLAEEQARQLKTLGQYNDR